MVLPAECVFCHKVELKKKKKEEKKIYTGNNDFNSHVLRLGLYAVMQEQPQIQDVQNAEQRLRICVSSSSQ